MVSYQYEPLSSPATQIRVLELLPGRGIIQCRLKTSNLEQATDTYEPISYCWKAYSRRRWPIYTYKESNKKQKLCRVCVNGKDFYVTESLRAALQRIRLNTEIRTLWADTICINQADDEEKSAQVAIMGKIYRSGKQTLAWIGTSDCWTGMAFRYLQTRASRRLNSSDSDGSYHGSIDESEHLSEDSDQSSHQHVWERVWGISQHVLSTLCVRSICCRPYFERAWIVQEIVLSVNVLFICGKHEITGDAFYGGLGNWGIVYCPRAVLTQQIVGEFRDNRSLYYLDTIIGKLSHTKASDPRDKLYSCLGLHHVRVCGRSWSEIIIVDYSKDVDDVFLDATKLLLSRSLYLDLLSMSYSTSCADANHLPSWVWNPQPIFYLYNFSFTGKYARRRFCASQRTKSSPQFRNRMLGLLGYVLGRVHKVGEVFTAGGTITLRDSEVLDALRVYLSWVKVSEVCEPGITHVESDRRMRAFRGTLKTLGETVTMEEGDESDRTYDEQARRFESFHGGIIKHFSSFLSPQSDMTKMRTKLKFMAATRWLHFQVVWDKPTFRDWEIFWLSGEGLGPLRNRCLVRLEDGMIGLCPRDTKQNDRLVLLQGARVPFVLRPSGDNWTLVGECFIYGVMHGEAWDQNRCEMLWIE